MDRRQSKRLANIDGVMDILKNNKITNEKQLILNVAADLEVSYRIANEYIQIAKFRLKKNGLR